MILNFILLCCSVSGLFHNNLFLKTNRNERIVMKGITEQRGKIYISPKLVEQYLRNLNSTNNTIQNNEIIIIKRFVENAPPPFPALLFRDSPENEEDQENASRNYIKEHRKYPLSPKLYGEYLRRINSKNTTDVNENPDNKEPPNRFRIIINNKGEISLPGIPVIPQDSEEDEAEYEEDETFEQYKRRTTTKKSENFEVITNYHTTFKDIGGYDNIKLELNQCVDILKNYTKYSKYNVRVPKGLILEGPPGNGKTLIAKALAGEAKVAFIPVSGSQFQDKYVGVGSNRIRELFELAKKHVPCIIFIDEIDAVGRKRSGDGETSGSERDSTLNELLVALDGFKNVSGVFIIGATNRVDLLDPALIRPGRIDKKIYIGEPDSKTRKAVLDIHTTGKPYDNSVKISDLVDLTNGLSCAQIENLVNEAMLNALRYGRKEMTYSDIEDIMNKMMVGWQPTEHQFTNNIIDHIAIHEMGHVVLGLLSKHHSKVSKVTINLSSPNSPAYTVFESSISNIYTREGLFEHLMILLSGRIAEEVFYGVSVTTGAINDFEEALKLAERMVVYYGMGKNVIYPRNSEKYKQMVDDEVLTLINNAYSYSEFIIRNSKDFISETSEILKRDKIIRVTELNDLINNKYSNMIALKMSYG